MLIAIKKLQNNQVYIDKTFIERFGEEYADKYGYSLIEIEETYKDCDSVDFNEDLTFNIDKYNARKQRHKDNKRISEIKTRLEQLSQDIIQSLAGAEFEDMVERQKEFQTLHNELRILLGKEPRKYLSETE